MKKNKLFLLLIPVMLLGACGNNNNHEQTTSEEPPHTSVPSEDPNAVLVRFYLSGSFYGVNDFDSTTYALKGGIVNKPIDPVSKDPAFNIFLGWSTKYFISNDSELWDFYNDTIPEEYSESTFSLYGQWDYVE